MKALVVLLALCSVARADDFDPEGWTLLANDHVNPTSELEVVFPSFVGKVDRVAIVVRHGSAQIVSVETESTSGRRKETPIDASLDADHRSFELSIPKRTAKLWVLLGEGTDTGTELAVMGKAKGAKSSRAAKPWNADGWETLGITSLSAGPLGSITPSSEAAYDRVAIVPTEELVVHELKLELTSGKTLAGVRSNKAATWRKEVPQLYELDNAGVAYVDFEYALRGAFEGTLTLYGLPHTATASELVAESVDPWVADGWTLLGEDDVDLVDQELDIARAGTWAQVALLADGDDIHVDAVGIGKDTFPLDADLDAGNPDRIIDLTGKRRAIKKVRLQYTKHRLDASTRVKVYAR